MHGRRRRWTLVAAAGCLLILAAAAPAPAPAATVIGEVLRPTPVSSYAAHVVWSAYDPRTRRYRLMLSVKGLEPAPVDVAPRTVPFDADLGPGPGGGVFAIYSRCRVEPAAVRPGNVLPAWNTARGCDLYRVNLQTGNEKRVARSSRSASEYRPTIWRTRIAFARRYEGRRGARGTRPDIYRARLFVERPSRRLPAGTRGPRTGSLTTGQPVGLDLRRGRVAVSWAFVPRPGIVRTELWSTTLRGDRTFLSRVSGSPGVNELLPPTQLTEQFVLTGRVRPGAQDLRAYSVPEGKLAVRAQVVPDRRILAVTGDHAVSGARGTYVLDAPEDGAGGGVDRACRGAGGRDRCRIVHVDDGPFGSSPPPLAGADEQEPQPDPRDEPVFQPPSG